MELSILAVFVVSIIFSVGSHPKHSDIIPKDYYKRQILQPIPGYIPVYIKADGEPIVRSENKNHAPNASPQKVTEPKGNYVFKESDKEISSESLNKESDEFRHESSVTKSEALPVNLQEKHEPVAAGFSKNEKQVKNSYVNSGDLKP